MNKTLGFGSLALLVASACGGSKSTNNPDASPPDAGGPPTNTGFVLPTKSTHANMSPSKNTWTDLGPADWTCLGTKTADAPLAADLMLTGQVQDFQTMDSNHGVANTMMDVFSDTDYTHPFKSLTTDGSGKFTVTIPAGKTRVGFKMHATAYMDTFLLNQYWMPSATTATINIGDISSGLATALPAFINFERTSGTGVLAGAMRDCQHREVSNAIATVSSVSGAPMHLTGMVGTTPVIASTFYFDASVGLPATHAKRISTDPDGLFTVFNLPAISTNAYIQVWGFTSDADIAKGMAGLTLLAELQAPVLADNVVTGSIEPLRTK